MTTETVDSDQLKNGDRAWYSEEGTEGNVYHGTVVASGPVYLVIDVDGPWSNVTPGARMTKRHRAKPGRAPPMGAESYYDYHDRCNAIVEREQRVAELEIQARRLGLTVSGISDGSGEQK